MRDRLLPLPDGFGRCPIITCLERKTGRMGKIGGTGRHIRKEDDKKVVPGKLQLTGNHASNSG